MGQSVILGNTQKGASCYGFRVVMAGGAGLIGGSWLPNSSRWSNVGFQEHTDTVPRLWVIIPDIIILSPQGLTYICSFSFQDYFTAGCDWASAEI